MATDETLNDAWGALPEEVRYKLAVARCGTRKEGRNRAINDAVLGMAAALAAAEARGVADVDAILAALPTPEERAAIDTTIRVAESFTEGHAIAWKKAVVREKVALARSYYTRTGGTPDGK